MSKEKYFPFGFKYPVGLAHNDANPDPMIEKVRERMAFLNEIYAKSTLPGHIFAAAMDLFQKESDFGPDVFWEKVQKTLTLEELAKVADALAPMVADEPARLDFPNAIALFDCRFVATKEWERIRRYSIGGSEASTVLKLSHFQSQRTLYHEKKDPPADKKDISWQQILDYGHAVEDYVVEEIADRLGAVRYPEYRMFAHAQYPFITCNPDAILVFPDGHYALFESKTALWTKKKDWKQGIPDYYEPQPRQYLEVLNDPKLTEGYIGVCVGGMPQDMVCHKYTRDPATGAVQVQEVVSFWQEHIVPGKQPEFSGNPGLDMQAAYMYLPHNENHFGSDTLDIQFLPEFLRYFDLKDQKKSIEKELRELTAEEAKLKQEIHNAVPEGITHCSVPNGITYEIKVGPRNSSSVDMTALRARDPDAYEQLLSYAEKLKETSMIWAVPKVAMAIDAPKKKKKGSTTT